MADRPYGANNIFTFQCGWNEDTYIEDQLRVPGPVTGYEQYDLGIVEINDEGDLIDTRQLEQIGARIQDARSQCPHGAIVVTFIHGWHNNADWDNANLVSFRRLLRALMNRELEATNRRVIGVYLGWNGTPNDGIGRWVGRLPGLKHTTFRDRYETAGRVGTGDAMGESLLHLTSACKTEDPLAAEAPLILVGHSMGAYILQSAYRALLEDPDAPAMSADANTTSGPVAVQSDQRGPMVTPDLLLSLNSAAESEVARDIISLAAKSGLEKHFSAGNGVTAFNPPLLVSATSEADSATDLVWRLGHFLEKSSTDGHDPTLMTHTFTPTSEPTSCAPAGSIDFGQPWHCLHKDTTPHPTPRFRIDLPDHDRSIGEPLTHTAYDLVPSDPETALPFWLFQVPGDVIADHSDIFNFKAASFVLALIQLSGVLASAAGTSWSENFSELPLS